MPNNSIFPEMTQKWVMGGATIIISIVALLGGIVASSHQSQIDKNQERIWQLQSTAVTEDKLNQQIRQVQDYIDVRIQSLETSQREMARQLIVLVDESKESRKETRDALESIRESVEKN